MAEITHLNLHSQAVSTLTHLLQWWAAHQKEWEEIPGSSLPPDYWAKEKSPPPPVLTLVFKQNKLTPLVSQETLG